MDNKQEVKRKQDAKVNVCLKVIAAMTNLDDTEINPKKNQDQHFTPR